MQLPENTDAPETRSKKAPRKRKETYEEWYPRLEAASNGETVNFPDHPFEVEWNRSTDFYQYAVGLDRSIVEDVARKVRKNLEKQKVKLKPRSPIILRILYDTRRGLSKLICTGVIVTTALNGAATCEPIEIELVGKPIPGIPKPEDDEETFPSLSDTPVRMSFAATFKYRKPNGVFERYLDGVWEHITQRVIKELQRRKIRVAPFLPIYVIIERYRDKQRGPHEVVTTCYCRICYVNTKNDTRAISFEFDMTFPA